jgi:hypothetical protein
MPPRGVYPSEARAVHRLARDVKPDEVRTVRKGESIGVGDSDVGYVQMEAPADGFLIIFKDKVACFVPYTDLPRRPR